MRVLNSVTSFRVRVKVRRILLFSVFETGTVIGVTELGLASGLALGLALGLGLGLGLG